MSPGPPATPSSPLLLKVLNALLVLRAEILEEIFVRQQRRGDRISDRLRVRAGIVERHVDLEMAYVRTPETLRHAQLLRVRMPHPVEPALLRDARRRNDERIAVPAPRGVTHPARQRILDRFAPVHEHLAEVRVLLVQQEDQLRRL